MDPSSSDPTTRHARIVTVDASIVAGKQQTGQSAFVRKDINWHKTSVLATVS